MDNPAIPPTPPTPAAPMPSPFKKASPTIRRLKLFFWGDSGAGKTTLALRFPKPAVIDLDGGTELYGKAFDFDVLPATTADEVMDSVNWLLGNKHPYRTLVIDPITIYWEALQKKWSDIFLRRNKGGKGYKFEFYDLQARDWTTLKSEFKELIRKLITLDMNVIVTARQKNQYSEGEFMRKIGETFDGEKSLPYLFDTVISLRRDEKSRFLGHVMKDRTNTLPTDEFEINYELFESLFGKEVLLRESKPVKFASKEQVEQITKATMLLDTPLDKVHQALAKYNAESIEGLTAEAAATILEKLNAALAAKEKAHAKD